MDSKANSVNKSSSIFTALLGTLAGVVIGVGGKYLYDKIEEDAKIKEQIENGAPRISVKERKEKLREKIKETQTDSEENNWEEYESFLCPISLEIMKDPVMTPQGITFERNSIEDWLNKYDSCPITKKPLAKSELLPNYSLKGAIREFMEKLNKNNKNFENNENETKEK